MTAGDGDGAAGDPMAEAVCRICFEDASAGQLVAPCKCRGSQGFIHEACLLHWRKLQVLHGKLAAASQCEICGARYAASLGQPGRPLKAVLLEFGRVLSETTLGFLLYCTRTTPFSALTFAGVAVFKFGVARALLGVITAFPAIVLMLYLQGRRLSLIGVPGREARLRLTAFGPPVDGLSSGMMLVSIRAGGPFRHTVLYVIEHSDRGTLAMILNAPLASNDGSEAQMERLAGRSSVGVRYGGPLAAHQLFCIHDVRDVPGSERLLRGGRVFLSRNVRSLQTLISAARQQAGHASIGRMVVVKGISSWGRHQLEGEVRHGIWGWIKPEHVRSEDILELDAIKLGAAWERLLHSPHLQLFHG